MPKYFEFSAVEEDLPEYSFTEHIDSGGFKDVFLADSGGERVVVKILPTERSSQKRRARREAEAMEQINSTSFVDLRDYDEVSIRGTPSFLLEEEYIDGPTLEEVLDNGGHGVDRAIEVTQTLLDLLIQFADLNIIHRDIKPQNIMFNSDGSMILLDVGIVRFEERESVTPDHAKRLGTPNYGAPEQLDYEKELQSIRTDIFSTGVVMFETLTGVHPYAQEGKSISEAIMDGERSNLSEFLDNDELAEQFGEMFERMTEQEPYHRYRKPEFAREKLDAIKEVAVDV